MIKKNRDRKKARNLKYVIIISYTLPSRFNAKQEEREYYLTSCRHSRFYKIRNN